MTNCIGFNVFKLDIAVHLIAGRVSRIYLFSSSSCKTSLLGDPACIEWFQHE